MRVDAVRVLLFDEGSWTQFLFFESDLKNKIPHIFVDGIYLLSNGIYIKY